MTIATTIPQPRLAAIYVLALAPNVLAVLTANNRHRNGLSNGAKIGIIVAIVLFVLFAFASFLFRRRRIQRANRAYAIAANRGQGGGFKSGLQALHPPPPPPPLQTPPRPIGGYRSESGVRRDGTPTTMGGSSAPHFPQAQQQQQEEPQMNEIRFPEPSHHHQPQQQTAPSETFMPSSGPPPEEMSPPSRNHTLPPYTVVDEHV